jgi:hypothetical protein
MKLPLLVALLGFASACGGAIAGDPAEANSSEMLSWTSGHCRHAKGISFSAGVTCIPDLTRDATRKRDDGQLVDLCLKVDSELGGDI